MPNLLNAYLLAKPSLRGWLEWSVLCGCGILGLALKGARVPWVPFSNAAGGILSCLACSFTSTANATITGRLTNPQN